MNTESFNTYYGGIWKNEYDVISEPPLAGGTWDAFCLSRNFWTWYVNITDVQVLSKSLYIFQSTESTLKMRGLKAKIWLIGPK